MSAVYLPIGSASGGSQTPVAITPERAGWTYCGLRIVEFTGSFSLSTGGDEMLVVPLSGGCEVVCDGSTVELEGRADVFARVTDFAYLPIQAEVTLRSAGPVRLALPSARAARRLPFRHAKAEDIPIEVRGAGPASRQVTNFCAPEAFECDKLVAVEVLTPGGNWSSYPPHKHDAEGPGEAVLEEIYYFETPGLAYQRVYGTTEVLAEVSTGDVVLVPDGYHGPSMAAPGFDLYYLNVLAGPAPVRTMACTDDPAYHWIRESWREQGIDPRTPMTSHRGRLS
ncbi:MAG: 5-deoxy-glucuronate isomerase [Hamadaea sp.]|uniref:5-deoxy-glucuronate isomerase n=1 Tax=Hamadaea sp. TaxID=2024425 RepID=UPI00179EAFB6|nr:5-deoxy-glucuronate isomerase [Hamadaea sp.]NUR71703.1 5-deoxy-glucuronate isomerase [Hamadaea sp.]NUT19017.1 5-deoxy-glucuronate isomerase [Hamadaea sp.]